jgi:hypothetical protein
MRPIPGQSSCRRRHVRAAMTAVLLLAFSLAGLASPDPGGAADVNRSAGRTPPMYLGLDSYLHLSQHS